MFLSWQRFPSPSSPGLLNTCSWPPRSGSAPSSRRPGRRWRAAHRHARACIPRRCSASPRARGSCWRRRRTCRDRSPPSPRPQAEQSEPPQHVPTARPPGRESRARPGCRRSRPAGRGVEVRIPGTVREMLPFPGLGGLMVHLRISRLLDHDRGLSQKTAASGAATARTASALGVPEFGQGQHGGQHGADRGRAEAREKSLHRTSSSNFGAGGGPGPRNITHHPVPDPSL